MLRYINTPVYFGHSQGEYDPTAPFFISLVIYSLLCELNNSLRLFPLISSFLSTY